jgi:THAP domain-containing protein 4
LFSTDKNSKIIPNQETLCLDWLKKNKMQIHPNLEKTVSFLIGTWKGEGVGIYPTIKTFEYEEELTFTPLPGKPILFFVQKTWKKDDKTPLHAESGYIRVPKENLVEMVNSQPTGVAEVYQGNVKEQTITLDSKSITRTEMTKSPHVLQTKRVMTVVNDQLDYLFDMSTTTNEKLENHLKASLKKVTK